MLTAADDGVHERPAGAPDSWQENCFLLARDDERDACVYFHVERLAAGTDLKVALDVGGNTTWAGAEGDWWYEVEAPFERSRWQWEGDELGMDLRLRSHLPAIDHSTVLATLGLPGAERDHYEAVGHVEGRVRVGGTDIEVAGLFVRDHTWGVREYQRFGASWWWPTCFDGGDAYAGGVAVQLDDRIVGYGLVADAAGVSAATDVEVTVDGTAEPGGYRGTVVRFTPPDRGPVTLTSESRRHLCATFPGFGPDRQWNEAYSTCRWEERIGFGTRELGC